MRTIRSLLKEAIQDNTDDALRSAVIVLSNGVRASAAIRASKAPLFKIAVGRMVANYAVGSRHDKNIKRAKDNASRVVGIVNFLFQVEDIQSIIESNVEMLTKKRVDYMNQLKQDYPDREPIEPTIEQFLQNQYRPFRIQFLNVLNGRSPLTKDPATIKFKTNAKDFYNARYDLITPESYDTFCKQLLKLTLDQLVDLSKKIQAVLPRIAQIKRVVGDASVEELRQNLFHIPPEQEKKEVEDQPKIKPNL